METKRCTKCGEEKPATAEYFILDSREENGLGAWCRVCHRPVVREANRHKRAPAKQQRLEFIQTRDKAMIEEYLAGATLKEIGDKYGMTWTGVAYRLELNGVERRRFKPAKDRTVFNADRIPYAGIPYPRESDISGIYSIVCLANGKTYIGSSVCLRTRRNSHLELLGKNKHPNIHLQRTYNKHGVESFSFRVLELCDASILIEREQYYVDTYQPEFNIAVVVDNPTKGRTLSDEERRAMSERLKGIPKSDETKQKMSEARKGENNGSSKLTWKTVREIRERYAMGNISQRQLSKEYGITPATMNDVLKNKSWVEG